MVTLSHSTLFSSFKAQNWMKMDLWSVLGDETDIVFGAILT